MVVRIVDRYPAFAVAAFVAVVALFGHRAIERLNVPGTPDTTHWAMQDFRDAVYWPVVAFLEGINPYDTPRYRAAYPVGAEFPWYSPSTLLVHLPFGLLSFRAAEGAYFTLCVVLVLVLAFLVLRICGIEARAGRLFALATMIQLSRPGYSNLLAGQVTLQVALGCLVALHWAKSRPWVAGLGLALASLKPTYGVPLALLMLCRRDFRAVAVGTAVGGIGAMIAAAVLVVESGGPAEFFQALARSYASFQADPAASPLTGTMRWDALATTARIIGWNPGPAAAIAVFFAVCAVCGLAVARCSRAGRSCRGDDLSSTIASLAILVSVYHMAYDALLLALPLVTVAAGSREPWRGLRTSARLAIFAAMSIPCVNYLATYEVLQRMHAEQGQTLWIAVTAVNGLGVLAALAACLWLAVRGTRHPMHLI
jgi:hypothetical protein